MTLSGTNNFWSTTEAIDTYLEAFERCGVLGGQLSGNQIESATRSTMALFSDWSNRGINLWKVVLTLYPLTTAQSTVTLPVSTIDVLQVYNRTTSGSVNNDLILTPISRAEYAALPNKLQQSNRPTQFYFERTITPVMYLWQIPQDATCTLGVYTMVMQQDVGALTNTLDAPQRWAEAIFSGLAAKLAVKFAPERVDMLKAEAKDAFDAATAEDTEDVPMRITPDTLGRRGL